MHRQAIDNVGFLFTVAVVEVEVQGVEAVDAKAVAVAAVVVLSRRHIGGVGRGRWGVVSAKPPHTVMPELLGAAV
jgi:gamma-glutamyltranspeptidase